MDVPAHTITAEMLEAAAKTADPLAHLEALLDAQTAADAEAVEMARTAEVGTILGGDARSIDIIRAGLAERGLRLTYIDWADRHAVGLAR